MGDTTSKSEVEPHRIKDDRKISDPPEIGPGMKTRERWLNMSAMTMINDVAWRYELLC